MRPFRNSSLFYLNSCKLPTLVNDTFYSQGEWHSELIDMHLPWTNDTQHNRKCFLRSIGENGTETFTKCNEWVYSKQYFEKTLTSDV